MRRHTPARTNNEARASKLERRITMIRVLALIALAASLGGCVVAPPYGYGYGYAPAPAYGYYAAPAVNVGVGFGGGWHR
jgi:hypothetical protein